MKELQVTTAACSTPSADSLRSACVGGMLGLLAHCVPDGCMLVLSNAFMSWQSCYAADLWSAYLAIVETCLQIEC